jgi:Flp pilus assembly protein TadD
VQAPRTLLLALVLALGAATCATYWQVRQHEFVTFDDNQFITDNRHVRDGLSAESVRWAFTTHAMGIWHPVTWLSHMVDCELFGLDAGMHHLVSVAIHVGNGALLLVLLTRMTGSPWRSAAVASLFLLHPLHVESVAWASERKDVLSTFLGLLALGAYVDWTRHGGRGRYLAALGCFALGLAAKSMIVTLPFLLLLLDAWPLGRTGSEPPWRAWRTRPALVAEKLPMLALAGAASVLTVAAQRAEGAYRPLDVVPLAGRLANAVVSYAQYLVATVWPVRLAVFYPYPERWSVLEVAGAGLLLAALTGVALASWRRRPHLAVGWLWYVGMLVPVIGLVQVGDQARADRYTYLPLVGVFLMVVWSIPDPRRGAREVTPLALTVVAVLGVLAAVTSAQLRHWRTGRALFERAVAVSPESAVAHSNLGAALQAEGDLDRAAEHFAEAVRLAPRFAGAHGNLGQARLLQGRVDEALASLRHAVALDPELASAHSALGALLARQGDLADATRHFRALVALEPEWADGHYSLGLARAAAGALADAAIHFRTALRLHPGHRQARLQLLLTGARIRLARPGRDPSDVARTILLASRASALAGGEDPLILTDLALAWAAVGESTRAEAVARHALALTRARGDSRLADQVARRLSDAGVTGIVAP